MTTPLRIKNYEFGSVHGRFQPPHLGHFEYIHEAMNLCDFLWIGIARPDIREYDPCEVAKHRADVANNPLTYFERITIIEQMLIESGKSRLQFGFVPFPIDKPERLPDFLPTSVVCFTTIYDDWNRHKVAKLQMAGYKVEVLWERTDKLYAGQAIRDSIRAGTSDWESMVPPATARILKDLDLGKRLAHLSASCE